MQKVLYKKRHITSPRPDRQTELLLKKINMLKSEIARLKIKSDYCDNVLLATNTVPTGEIGELFGMSAQRVNKLLEKEGIIYRIDKRWRLKGKYQKMGLGCPATHMIKKNVNEGSYRAFSHLRWSQKGVYFCYHLLIEKGCKPLR